MNKEGRGGFQDHPELRNNGHPMAGTSYKEIFQRIADEPPGYEPEPHQIRSKKEEHCRAWFRKSYDDIRAFESVVNRVEGKPTEHIEGNVSVNLNIQDLTREIREFLEVEYPEAHERLLEHLRDRYDSGTD